MSLLSFIKNLFSSSSEAEKIPEDSMLRRHYLANLKAQAEAEAKK